MYQRTLSRDLSKVRCPSVANIRLDPAVSVDCCGLQD